MGYDLEGKGGSFRWQFDDWPAVLRLAQDYGWRPSGTILLTGRGWRYDPYWCRAYDSNDGQMVMQTDALRLAVALRKAVRDHLAHPRKKKLAKFMDGLGGVEHLMEFAKFCKAGPFRIF